MKGNRGLQKQKNYFPLAKVDQETLTELVKPSIDYVRHKKFRSGNYPSSLSNETDRLVHWCHGAPGVVHMLLQAHKDGNQGKHRVTKRGPALSNPMFTLVTGDLGIVGRWRASRPMHVQKLKRNLTSTDEPKIKLLLFIRTRSIIDMKVHLFKEDKYLKDAVDCGDVIWQRGLLRKGYGICHGTSGNGYAFLSLFHHTQDKKYLYRACKLIIVFYKT
ncbi:unnamed protein product [Ranitomeya imitator]|uniref:Uncharacterized protein n=1 Tax=Ranitomeya imitator TaxID=111125 RepID=A0ABN9KQP0_9NEOB|nr:unnamed protein product [Ranitomeya imitator]